MYEVTLYSACEIIPQRPHQMSHANGFTHHFYDAMRYDADIDICTLVKTRTNIKICIWSVVTSSIQITNT